jgi:hypothetical protein
VIEKFQQKIKLTLQRNKVERTKMIKEYAISEITNYINETLACEDGEDVTIEGDDDTSLVCPV